MLLGMPIASTVGFLGSPKKPMIIPWILNRNGQSITLKAHLKGKVAADPKALKPLVEEAKNAGEPMNFAMTFPPGTHAMWIRYYLGAGGINPDKDVALITIPPPQMVANMNVGKMDGYCVGSRGTRAPSPKGSGLRRLTPKIFGRIIRKRYAPSRLNSRIRIRGPSRRLESLAGGQRVVG
jgi:hypothetical protein